MDSVTARALLGVHPSADADEIKRAFRRLARTVHPDHGGTDAGFRRLLDAQRVALDSAGPGRSMSHVGWVTDSARRSTVSIVEPLRVRRSSDAERPTPSRRFGDVLARHLDAA
jgi:hypothetical protein